MELSKGESRWKPFEPLILYLVLFFPGVYAPDAAEGIDPAATIPFSALGEAARTLTYTLPSLALLWYFISGIRRGEETRDLPPELTHPGMRDCFALLLGLPLLVLIGLGISFLIPLFSQSEGAVPPPRVEAPSGIAGWIVMVLSCLCTGYLEESFFRYYLLTEVLPSGVRAPLLSPAPMLILSTLLFSVCHIYEGPWGVLNAALAGILLSLLFFRFKSIHGIAAAHGGYNIFVYIMGNFIS